MSDVKAVEHFNLRDRLHTDVLEDKYGPIHARVVRHDSLIREVYLDDEKNICRTYAITFFSQTPRDPEINTIDLKIKAGGLIGKTFREHGYEVRKNVIGVRTVNLPDYLISAFNIPTGFAKARLSEFYAKKEGNEPQVYGRVVEIYSPDFRSPVVNIEDIQQVNPITEAFLEAGLSKDIIWEKLGSENNWSGEEPKYELAKERSLAFVAELNTKLDVYLQDVQHSYDKE